MKSKLIFALILIVVGVALGGWAAWTFASYYFTAERWQQEAVSAYLSGQVADQQEWWYWSPLDIAYGCWSTVASWAQSISAVMTVLGGAVTVLKNKRREAQEAG